MNRRACGRRVHKATFVITVCALLGTCGMALHSADAEELPPGFVRLKSIDSSIQQDIRYASSDNFVGRPIAGYERGECWLRREVAERLAQVQADLVKTGLQLIVYDCYRPIRAVEYFMKWAQDPLDQSRNAEQYPTIEKSKLVKGGYIAAVSAHSKGVAVDVGLARLGAGENTHNQILDLGTPFDFFGPAAYTASPLISQTAKRNRILLLTAMARRGFRNYWREWWHFSMPEARRLETYDVPIRP
jgi:zinc D-Ala-D-Ala dipeptidase